MKKSKNYIIFILLLLPSINLLNSQESISEELEINRRYVFNFKNERDSKLSESMKKLLNLMIKKVNSNESVFRIKIDAHSFAIKINPDILQKVSDDRANNAYRYSVSKGMSKSKILYRGYGNRIPILEANNPESIMKNNRIEFMLMDK